MSDVKSSIISAGGSIHLNYAPGSEVGISNPITLGLQLQVVPSGDIPDGLIELILPEGHFKFNNNSNQLVRDLGKVTDGQAVNVEFKIVCDIPDPSADMSLIIHSQDKFDTGVDTVLTTYSVKTQTTTEGNISLLFLSR